MVVSASASTSDARNDFDGDAPYGPSEEEAEINEVDECENDSASAETSPVKKVEVVVNWTGLAYNEAKDELDGESEKIEARRHPSKVFSNKHFHEVDRVKCKGGYNVILKCINCGTEGQNNTFVKNHLPTCARLVKIEEAVDEFNRLYPKLAITSSGRKNGPSRCVLVIWILNKNLPNWLCASPNRFLLSRKTRLLN